MAEGYAQRHLAFGLDRRAAPAAMEQLRVLGAQAGVPVVDTMKMRTRSKSRRAACGRDRGTMPSSSTRGRLQIDEGPDGELERLRSPSGLIILCSSPMRWNRSGSGQRRRRDFMNASRSQDHPHQLDSDAAERCPFGSPSTGAPILFGDRREGSTRRYLPSGSACVRILGMGDVLTLIEKTQANYDQTKAKELERKFKKNEFTLTDFAEQMRHQENGIARRPGRNDSGSEKGCGAGRFGESKRELVRIRRSIDSMTLQERENHLILNGKRRSRIAGGSGTSVQDVNRFLKQFEQTRQGNEEADQDGRRPRDDARIGLG